MNEFFIPIFPNYSQNIQKKDTLYISPAYPNKIVVSKNKNIPIYIYIYKKLKNSARLKEEEEEKEYRPNYFTFVTRAPTVFPLSETITKPPLCRRGKKPRRWSTRSVGLQGEERGAGGRVLG